MLLALQVLFTLQPSPVIEQQPEFRECPTGVFVRPGQQCPTIGPHPTTLFFEWDQIALTERSRLSLDFYADRVRRLRSEHPFNPSYLIEAHADRSGPAAYNLDLARRRAEAVRDYLVARGLSANTIGITYLGEERPVVETADGVPEPDNRRVIVWSVEPERFSR